MLVNLASQSTGRVNGWFPASRTAQFLLLFRLILNLEQLCVKLSIP